VTLTRLLYEQTEKKYLQTNLDNWEERQAWELSDVAIKLLGSKQAAPPLPAPRALDATAAATATSGARACKPTAPGLFAAACNAADDGGGDADYDPADDSDATYSGDTVPTLPEDNPTNRCRFEWRAPADDSHLPSYGERVYGRPLDMSCFADLPVQRATPPPAALHHLRPPPTTPNPYPAMSPPSSTPRPAATLTMGHLCTSRRSGRQWQRPLHCGCSSTSSNTTLGSTPTTIRVQSSRRSLSQQQPSHWQPSHWQPSHC
jgi:hypothetical protein